MNRMLRSFSAIIIAGLFVASSTDASAEPAEERVLVLAVSKGRGSDSRLVKALSEHLQRSGMTLTGESLSSSDRACESSECIEALATRESAQLILTAQLQENAPNTVFITMALFDAVRKALFQATALCDQCNHDTLIGKLSDVADRLIKQSREARQTPVHSAEPPHVPIVPLVSSGGPDIGSKPSVANGNPLQGKQGYFDKLSPKRKIAAGVLGGIGVATLITSVALAATNGQKTTALGCNLNMNVMNDYCELQNTPLFGAGFALTGALAIGIGFTLFWPENTPKSSVEGSH